MNRPAHQWLVGPSSLSQSNGEVEAGSSPEGIAQNDMTSSDYSVISARPSDVNGLYTNGTAFTESLAAGLTKEAAADFICNLLQQNKQLKDSLSESNRRVSELFELVKKLKLDLVSQSSMLLAKDNELRQKDAELTLRNSQCKQRVEELRTAVEKNMTLRSLHQPTDSVYASGGMPSGLAGGSCADDVVLIVAEAEVEDEAVKKNVMIANLESEVKAKDEQIRRLSAQIAELRNEISSLGQELNGMKFEQHTLTEKLGASMELNTKYEAELNDLQGRNIRLRDQISGHVSKIVDLEEQNTFLRRQSQEQKKDETTQAQHAQLLRKLEELTAQLTHMQQNVDRCEREKQQLLHENQRLEQEQRSLSERLRSLQDTSSFQLDQLTLKHSTTEAALTAERRENHRIRQILNEKSLKLDDMTRNYESIISKPGDVATKQKEAELKERNSELENMLMTARQLTKRRDDEIVDLNRRLLRSEERADSADLLKHQLELYRLDFEAERHAREEKHAEAERLRDQVEQIQLRHQQLVDELESMRHLEDMRRRHAAGIPANFEAFSRAPPVGAAGSAGSAAGGSGTVLRGAQPWTGLQRVQPIVHAEVEQSEQLEPPRMTQYRPPNPADPKVEYPTDARPGYTASQLEQQQRLVGSQQQLRPQQASRQQHHQPPEPARLDSLRCPVCNIEVPDYDSLNVHVNECIDSGAAT